MKTSELFAGLAFLLILVIAFIAWDRHRRHQRDVIISPNRIIIPMPDCPDGRCPLPTPMPPRRP